MDFLDWSKKTIVITGCAQGLGASLALSCAKQGARVVGTYHTNKAKAEEVFSQLSVYRKDCVLYQLDVRSASDVERVFGEIIAHVGRIDVLINNVGSFIYKPISETSFQEFSDVIETNLYSTFLCTKAVIEHMKENTCGHVINLGCAGAERMVIREKTTPYYIAKTGVIMLTKVFAEQYAQYGIHVNAVSPGILENSIAPLKMPSGRQCRFDDIFHAVTFLLSPSSDYVNGSNIEVAGGWVV